jgi:aldehyde:ferredoxin oxidoreductase
MTYSTPRHVLRVDLTERVLTRERVPDRWVRRYLGGKGLGARYLYEELEAGTDPLGPENLLAFLVGPLSGVLPGDPRYAAVTKSPLTGAFLDSYSGGSFPAVLAGALDGGLGVIVTGRADEPVVLTVEDGTGAVEPAGDLWGADAVETDEAFPDAAVACVGPAGERRVAYATIASDGADHHAGRGGAGAVMGAKRLKAVVARGEPPEALAELRAAYEEAFREDDTGRWLSAGTTVESLDFANEVGALATRGWRESQFDGADGIGVESARDAAAGRERAEDAVPGDFRVESDDGESVLRGGAPMALGAGLGVDEFDAVAALGATCDRLGMDVISAGNAVAWTVLATDAGAVDRDVSFGDAEAARELIREIATRETELADALAEGVERAAVRLDADGAASFIPTVKSMALPSYDPRAAMAMALAYATSDRGGCHRRARPIEREAFDGDGWADARRVTEVIAAQNARSVLWSLVVDDFAGETLRGDLGAEWLAAVDHPADGDPLPEIGERIWTLVRLFNAREGFDRDDDELPPALREPVENGPNAGSALDPEAFERLLDLYYAARGWGPNGLPTEAAIDRLGLVETLDSETPLDPEPASLPSRGSAADSWRTE